MANDPRHLHAVSIEVPISSLADFWLWRVQARNVVDYRRASRWWSELTLCVWLRHDNRLCGILSLGAVTPDEFLAAVRRRWPITLQTIDPEKVREEVYAVIRPGQIADFGSKGPSGNKCIEEVAAINITRADFHGERNYTIRPSDRSDTAVNP
jgi:hypothetical protein